MPKAQSPPKTADHGWRGLYRTAGVSALIMVAITLAQFVVFFVAPPPLEGGAGDWFAFFQNSKIHGLLGFEFSLVIYALLSVLVSAALFTALRPACQSLAALFLVSSLIGGIAFVMARPALEMLSLSNQYAAATTETQKAASWRWGRRWSPSSTARRSR